MRTRNRQRCAAAWTLAACILAVASSGAAAQPAKPAAPAAKRPQNPVVAPIPDDPRLPRVLLIGDSISMGYTLPVRELLAGKANVHRIPQNGGPTSLGIKQIQAWLGDGKWDVIHFNFGIHDAKYLPEGTRRVEPADYEKNLRELVRVMKAGGAKLIWASTTPVPPGELSPGRKFSDITAYNAIAKKVMDENGVAIDDLYAAMLPQVAKYQNPHDVHYTPEGSQFLARQVAASIAAQLPKR